MLPEKQFVFLKETVKDNTHLQDNLSVAAHLIRGSSKERFTTTYYTAGFEKMRLNQLNLFMNQ
jgi:hypothetical protein